jgi:hypothetical protein
MLVHCLSVTVDLILKIELFSCVSLIQFLLFKVELFVDMMLSPCWYTSDMIATVSPFHAGQAHAACMSRENHFNATDSSHKYNTHSNLISIVNKISRLIMYQMV